MVYYMLYILSTNWTISLTTNLDHINLYLGPPIAENLNLTKVVNLESFQFYESCATILMF